MNILFLDIDGVLRTHKSDLEWSDKLGQPIPFSVFDRNFSEKSVNNINEIIAYTRAKIVISSTWKNKLSLKELQDIFIKQGIHGDVIDKTTSLQGSRGEEIYEWIYIHEPSRYIVIDDQVESILNYIPVENVLKTDPSIGFEDYKFVDEVINILL